MLHAYGCDSVLETGCILIQGRSVEEVPEGVEVPQVKGWRHARMDVRAFRAKIEVLSPTSARTSIVANVDPKAPVPQSVVNYVVRSPFIANRGCFRLFACYDGWCPAHSPLQPKYRSPLPLSGAQDGWDVLVLPEANREMHSHGRG